MKRGFECWQQALQKDVSFCVPGKWYSSQSGDETWQRVESGDEAWLVGCISPDPIRKQMAYSK